MKATESPAGPRRIRILLVDDHPVVRLGFTQLLSHEPDLDVCGGGESVAEALELLEALDPDLLVIDVSLQGESGLELVKKVRACRPELPMLVCSMHDESLFAERALRAGARGYVGKREAPDALVEAVRTVAAGERYLSPRYVARLDASGPHGPLSSLTDRELEVLGLIGRGLGTREIAAQLGIAFKTVETHREHIKDKLMIESGPALARWAVAWVLGEA
jgi:DNA-binding NarL/FixJ family response regulator